MKRFELENKIVWYLLNEYNEELNKNDGEHFTTRKSRLNALRKEINKILFDVENSIETFQKVIDYENY